MPSTYTTNGGIEKIASGEQSGTWGTTTNTNFDIIDRLTDGVGSISLSGTSSNLQTTDGTLSDGMYKVLVLSGSPSGTHTITVLPNNAQKLYFVDNNSGQSCIFSQGSGANVTVENGKTAILYCNGAGSGAAVSQIIDTSSLIDFGITSTSAELNLLDSSAAGTIVNSKGVIYGSSGEVNATTLQIAGASITSTAAELNYNDITTLGTSQASKVVTADANGVVTFDNSTITESTAITSSSNAATINLRDGDNFTHTLSENVTYTFSNPASSGKVSVFSLKVTQDSTARSITWPASVDWASATAPTLTTTSGGVDVFVFATYDGGSTYYGFTAGQAMG
tara:strand:- start:2357 stop:3367 length:1011 start_codon:yes stop_codon:yes gene_type:complete